MWCQPPTHTPTKFLIKYILRPNVQYVAHWQFNREEYARLVWDWPDHCQTTGSKNFSNLGLFCIHADSIHERDTCSIDEEKQSNRSCGQKGNKPAATFWSSWSRWLNFVSTPKTWRRKFCFFPFLEPQRLVLIQVHGHNKQGSSPGKGLVYGYRNTTLIQIQEMVHHCVYRYNHLSIYRIILRAAVKQNAGT